MSKELAKAYIGFANDIGAGLGIALAASQLATGIGMCLAAAFGLIG